MANELNEAKLKEDLSKLVENETAQEVVQEKTYSELEQRAMEKGWRPKEEYDGDPEEWVDAKEFVGRGKLYEAIHDANRKVKKLEEQLNALSEWHTKTEKTAYDKALKDLQRAKNEALKAEDAVTAIKADEQIRELEKQAPKEAPKTEDKSVRNKEVFDKFLGENPWYNEDIKLKRFATGVGFSIEQEHPDWDIEDILKEVVKETKERFPEKFGKKQTTKVVKTNATTTSTGGNKKEGLTFNDLDENGKLMYKRLVKTGVLTHDQYMKDYASHQ